MKAAEQQQVPVSQLKPSPYNPRLHTDSAKFRELKQSISERGMLVPLLVRPLGKKESAFEVVGGCRRLRCAKELKLESVPCLVRKMDDVEAERLALIENLQREDIHPLDEGKAYFKLLSAPGTDVKSIAAKLGKSPTYVQQRLKLHDLIPEARKPYLQDRLTLGHALLIARLTEQQQKDLVKRLLDGELSAGYEEIASVAALRQRIESEIHLDLHGAPFSKADEQLLAEAGSCVACPKRTGANTLLFPDVEKKDTCTDPACFNAKLNAHLVRLEAEEEKKPPEKRLVRIVAYGYQEKEFSALGALKPGDWAEVKPRACSNLKKGLLMLGPKRGTILVICADKNCKVHAGLEHHYGSGISSGDRLRTKQRESQERLKLKIGTATLLSVAGKVKKIERQHLELVARRLFFHLWHESKKKVIQLLFPEAFPKTSGWNQDGWVDSRVPQMTDSELARFLIACSIIPGLDNNYHGGTGKELAALAKKHSVDAAKISRELRAEANAKQKKKAGAKKAKTTKAKPKAQERTG